MVQKQTLNLFRKAAGVVAPPPKLTVSQWADSHRVLSKKSSAEPGKWNTDRAPYQREIRSCNKKKALGLWDPTLFSV